MRGESGYLWPEECDITLLGTAPVSVSPMIIGKRILNLMTNVTKLLLQILYWLNGTVVSSETHRPIQPTARSVIHYKVVTQNIQEVPDTEWKSWAENLIVLKICEYQFVHWFWLWESLPTYLIITALLISDLSDQPIFDRSHLASISAFRGIWIILKESSERGELASPAEDPKIWELAAMIGLGIKGGTEREREWSQLEIWQSGFERLSVTYCCRGWDDGRRGVWRWWEEFGFQL